MREITFQIQGLGLSVPAENHPAQTESLFEVLVTSGLSRLGLWQAIEQMARGRVQQRTNISLQRSHVLLTNGVPQGVVLVTTDTTPRIDHLLVNALLNRAEVGMILLVSALESLRVAGVQQVTARVNEDDTELIAVFQDFGFTV